MTAARGGKPRVTAAKAAPAPAPTQKASSTASGEPEGLDAVIDDQALQELSGDILASLRESGPATRYALAYDLQATVPEVDAALAHLRDTREAELERNGALWRVAQTGVTA